MKRLIEPELLDELPADDPAAVRSRRDLRRVNWWMGNARWLARTLKEELPVPPRSIVELGGGDGTLMVEVARRLAAAWKIPVRLYLVDRQNLVSPGTKDEFGRHGWGVEVLQIDLNDWIERPGPASCDLVVANLFLHHFPEETLKALFRRVAGMGGAFIACEPRRGRKSVIGTELLWLIGCNKITRHDGRVSVRAGFQGNELSTLWPGDGSFTLREAPAGFASHLFFAQRVGGADASTSPERKGGAG